MRFFPLCLVKVTLNYSCAFWSLVSLFGSLCLSWSIHIQFHQQGKRQFFKGIKHTIQSVRALTQDKKLFSWKYLKLICKYENFVDILFSRTSVSKFLSLNSHLEVWLLVMQRVHKRRILMTMRRQQICGMMR